MRNGTCYTQNHKTYIHWKKKKRLMGYEAVVGQDCQIMYYVLAIFIKTCDSVEKISGNIFIEIRSKI